MLVCKLYKELVVTLETASSTINGRYNIKLDRDRSRNKQIQNEVYRNFKWCVCVCVVGGCNYTHEFLFFCVSRV